MFSAVLLPVSAIMLCCGNNTATETENDSIVIVQAIEETEEISTESQYIETQLYSKFMQQNRTIAVYLPANYTKSKTYPVIYGEDGLVIQSGRYKELLDSLIGDGLIEPVIVAVSYENKNVIPGYRMAYRNAEYVEAIANQDPQLTQIYNNHLNYFVREFIPYIEINYSVAKDREGRVYYGTSNSADFGLTLSFRMPDLFGEYWCFSPVYSQLWDYKPLAMPTKSYIDRGSKEEQGDMMIYFSTLIDFLRRSGGDVTEWTFQGGHDRAKWRADFIKMLQTRFGVGE